MAAALLLHQRPESAAGPPSESLPSVKNKANESRGAFLKFYSSHGLLSNIYASFFVLVEYRIIYLYVLRSFNLKNVLKIKHISYLKEGNFDKIHFFQRDIYLGR